MTGFVQQHIEEGLRLTGDALIDLYEIKLKAAPGQPISLFTNGATVTWQGRTYEAAPIKMTGTSRSSEDEKSRPTLTITDGLGAFVEAAHMGYFDYAEVKRFRVLGAHLSTNTNLAEVRVWYVARPREVIPGQYIALELRSLSDGPQQLLPARKYIPPEFPFVTL